MSETMLVNFLWRRCFLFSLLNNEFGKRKVKQTRYLEGSSNKKHGKGRLDTTAHVNTERLKGVW